MRGMGEAKPWDLAGSRQDRSRQVHLLQQRGVARAGSVQKWVEAMGRIALSLTRRRHSSHRNAWSLVARPGTRNGDAGILMHSPPRGTTQSDRRSRHSAAHQPP